MKKLANFALSVFILAVPVAFASSHAVIEHTHSVQVALSVIQQQISHVATRTSKQLSLQQKLSNRKIEHLQKQTQQQLRHLQQEIQLVSNRLSMEVETVQHQLYQEELIH